MRPAATVGTGALMADYQVERDLLAVTDGHVSWRFADRVSAVLADHPPRVLAKIEQLEFYAGEQGPLSAHSVEGAEVWLKSRPGTALTSAFIVWRPSVRGAARGGARVSLRLDKRTPMLWVRYGDQLRACELADRIVIALRDQAESLSRRGVSTRSGARLNLPGPPVLSRLREKSDVNPDGTRATPSAGPPAAAPTVTGPTAVISWSHTDPGWTDVQKEARETEVLRLAARLRANGIDVDVDLYHRTEAVSWTHWGPRMVTDSEFVIVVVSEAWRNAWERRGDPTQGSGAAAEANALQTLLASNQDAFLRKVRLVLLPGTASTGRVRWSV